MSADPLTTLAAFIDNAAALAVNEYAVDDESEARIRATYDPAREALYAVAALVKAAQEQAAASEGNTLVALDDALAPFAAVTTA